jgi:hypothetical protein
LGKSFGVMFPTLFGCRTTDELTRVRGGDKTLPGRILGALPKQKWVRPLQHRGQDLLATRWHHVADKSPATPAVGGSGPGWATTVSAKSLASSWVW